MVSIRSEVLEKLALAIGGGAGGVRNSIELAMGQVATERPWFDRLIALSRRVGESREPYCRRLFGMSGRRNLHRTRLDRRISRMGKCVHQTVEQ
jgi:hypothetical protein